MDNKNKLSLKDDVGFPLYLCSKEIIRNYNLLLDKFGLTYTQFIVMMFFWEKGNSNVKDIGNALLLDSGTLTPLLKKLEIKGYVTRERSSMDERNLNVKITNEGKKLKDKVLSIPSEIDSIIKISKEEKKTLYSLLQKVLINMDKEL